MPQGSTCYFVVVVVVLVLVLVVVVVVVIAVAAVAVAAVATVADVADVDVAVVVFTTTIKANVRVPYILCTAAGNENESLMPESDGRLLVDWAHLPFVNCIINEGHDFVVTSHSATYEPKNTTTTSTTKSFKVGTVLRVHP